MDVRKSYPGCFALDYTKTTPARVDGTHGFRCTWTPVDMTVQTSILSPSCSFLEI